MSQVMFDPSVLDFQLPKELIYNRPSLNPWFKDTELVVFERKTGTIRPYPFGELPEILDDQLCYVNKAVLDKNSNHLFRYQCIWASEFDKSGNGSFAVPSAGLPVDASMKGLLNCRGLGLWMPEKKTLNQDQMYAQNRSEPEEYRIQTPPEFPVIAIGTTVVKALESYGVKGETEGVSDLLITPGFNFKYTRGLLTNFHYPKEPLMAMVAAFTGVEACLDIYKYALEMKNKFIDFGDRLLVI